MPMPVPVLMRMSGGISPARSDPDTAGACCPLAAIPEAGVDAKFKCVSAARGRPEMPV